MADEYVPEYVDKKALVQRSAQNHTHSYSLRLIYFEPYLIDLVGGIICRLCKAMGGAEKVEIEWGNHSLSNRVQEAVQAIISFVKVEGPKGWDDPWS